MPVAGVLSLVGAVGSIYSGFSARAAAGQEAGLQQEQGDIALQESKVNAANEAFNQTQAVQRQRLAFLANGISLEGSPSLVLEKSKEYGQSQVDAILRQGMARYNLAQSEARITQNKGRAAMIGGFMQAAGTVAQAGGKAYQAGMLDSMGNKVGTTYNA